MSYRSETCSIYQSRGWNVWGETREYGKSEGVHSHLDGASLRLRRVRTSAGRSGRGSPEKLPRNCLSCLPLLPEPVLATIYLLCGLSILLTSTVIVTAHVPAPAEQQNSPFLSLLTTKSTRRMDAESPARACKSLVKPHSCECAACFSRVSLAMIRSSS